MRRAQRDLVLLREQSLDARPGGWCLLTCLFSICVLAATAMAFAGFCQQRVVLFGVVDLDEGVSYPRVRIKPLQITTLCHTIIVTVVCLFGIDLQES